MQITKKNLSPSKIQLTLTADKEQLQKTKQNVLKKLAADVRVAGFRMGKAPLNLVEKNLNPTSLQNEFLDQALNVLYINAIQSEKLRPLSEPSVKITKFVPFSALEVSIEVEVLGQVKLPDYKKIKLAKKKATVTDKELNEVIEQMRNREATRKDVTRAAKAGDEVVISFEGSDAKTKEAIKGADGKDYPLVIGSNAFIPGFEDNLIGLKAEDNKSFPLTFPKDYGVQDLASRKVTFNVTVSKVSEVVRPKIDDAFAAKFGPFKNLAEMKADIKKELKAEKEREIDREYINDLLTKITEGSVVAVPDVLVDSQIEKLEQDQKQNLVYRGQTWQEFLESQNLTEEEYRKKIKPDAEMRVKAGLVLAEIAELEQITVTPEELEIRMQLLKGQYTDKQMRAELDRPESRREINSRMISEKAADKLASYAAA